ncbi:DNA topoisomerase III [Klebsiella oxytoca]|uniref:DNA topoisomerase III n=1 Tax=Klebsiella oxytoca TaxID=571 RepID=UPI001904A1D6|nr:DNA topoisomerase III [Klebsiella oxytoca]MBK0694906.1 DNA topoisomerase III [Klebsiella oxytoca]
MQLYLCEKPSQARDIARALDARNRSDGYLHNATVTITWCFGHLLSMAEPEDYDPTLKHWRADHLPFIPPAWRLVIRPEVRKQFRIIEKLLKQADAVVIATDADREGETIAREILEQCRWRGPVQRLWLSALDDASIHKALAALRPGDSTFPLYQAGLARARADWLVGINMTRACTLMNRRHKGVLSVGRVQTPTLRLVVERDREIARFTPRPWWRVDARLHAEGCSFLAQWQPDSAYCDDEGRCIRESAAREATARLQQAGTALVMDMTTRREKMPPPLAFTLSALQQACSKQWGMGAQEVLDIAQRLYETHKATTYPRTDCGYLPLSMHAEAPQVLAALVASDTSLQPLATQLNLQQRSRLWDDSKITAHHGIIPTRKTVDLTQLNDSERKVYGLVRSHFLAQFLPDHEVDKTDLRLNCAGETLTARGSVVIVSGWRQLFLREMATHSPEETQALPALQQGQTCQVEQVDVRARQTQPPEHYTEGTLIAAMKNAARFVSDERLKQRLKENAGIGTEATRAGIIQTLLKRGYLIKQRRFLLATDTASTLIDALPETLKDPGTTALWEQMLDDIATGKMGLEAFLVQQQEAVTALTAQIVRGQKNASSG